MIKYENKIFDFIYNEAMLDATRQTEAAGAKKDLLRNLQLKNIVKEYASGVLNGDVLKISFEDASEKFNELKLNGTNEMWYFTFGNFQKLLNITMKYLYIAVVGNPKLKENFKVCHCPMDREMIRKVWGFYKARSGDNQDNELIYYIYKDERSSDHSRIAWSKITCGGDAVITISSGCKTVGRKIYDNYQEMVRQLSSDLDISPIEFDYLCWDGELGKLKELVQEKDVSWKNEI